MLNPKSESTDIARAWRQAGPAFLLMLVALFALYWGSFSSMVGLWMGSENYAHAVVVPPISLWLIWQRRRELLAMSPAPSPWFLVLLLALSLAWLVGDLSQTNALTHFTVVLMLVTLVPAVLGPQIAKLLAFPLAFLFFAVPFGEFLFPVMMDATADFTVAALRLTGVPVYREGLQFVIPSGNWSVIEACSGLRYLIASLMVGALFGYLNYRSLSKRLLFFGVSIIVPLLANWVRAYMIVMIGHLSGNKLAVGVDHLIYGWVFFGVVMLLMFVIGSRFADNNGQPEAAASVSAQLPVSQASAASSSTAVLLLTLATAAVLAVPHLVMAGLQRTESTAQPRLDALQTLSTGWQPLDGMPGTPWEPEFLPPAAVLQQAFKGEGGATVGLYVGYYRHQDSRSKLVSSQNMLVRSKNERWTQMHSGSARVELDGAPMQFNESELRTALGMGSEQRLILWQVYWVNGSWTHSNAQAKLYGALHRLMGRGDDGASVVFYTDKASAAGAQQVLSTFVRENLSVIEKQLRRTRGDDIAIN